MKISGKFLVGRLLAATLLLAIIWGGISIMSNDESDDKRHWNIYEESAAIPPEAVYLGGDMGGDFVLLKRQDIRQENGQILPAFYVELYGAWANKKNYGEERIGRLTYKGPAIYVPPKKLVEESQGKFVEPPTVDQILVNNGRWVDGGVLHVRLKPYDQDPNDEYVAQIVPVK